MESAAFGMRMAHAAGGGIVPEINNHSTPLTFDQKIEAPISMPPPTSSSLPPPQYYNVDPAHSFAAHPPPFIPPSMLELPTPDHYSVSRERTSHARGHEEVDHFSYHGTANPVIQRYREHGEHDRESFIMSREMALEVDAARALNELSRNRGLNAMRMALEIQDAPQSPLEERHEGGRYYSVGSNSRSSNDGGAATPFSSGGSYAGGDVDGSGESEVDVQMNSPSFMQPPPSPSASTSSRARRSRKARSGVPVPVPFLTKPSRGRRVPTAAMADANTLSTLSAAAGVINSEEDRKSLGRSSAKKAGNAAEVAAKIGASARAYVCQVEGCGKAFRRGEHLKRHVRSLHTHEKPERCTFPGCGKEFSRRDNMQQHLKIHGHVRNSTSGQLDEDIIDHP